MNWRLLCVTLLIAAVLALASCRTSPGDTPPSEGDRTLMPTSETMFTSPQTTPEADEGRGAHSIGVPIVMTSSGDNLVSSNLLMHAFSILPITDARTQTTLVEISLVLTDSSGAVVPSARVTVCLPDARQIELTDAGQGTYYATIGDRPVGEFVFEASHSELGETRVSVLMQDYVIIPPVTLLTENDSIFPGDETILLTWEPGDLAAWYSVEIFEMDREQPVWSTEFLFDETETEIPEGILGEGEYLWLVHAYASPDWIEISSESISVAHRFRITE